jgi:hypothetical protein
MVEAEIDIGYVKIVWRQGLEEIDYRVDEVPPLASD